MPGYGTGTIRYGGDRGTAPGTAATSRVDPHEALYLNKRYVDEVVIDVSDYKTLKVVKSIGGLSSFTYGSSAYEWIEDDLYKRSDILSTTLTSTTTAVVVTGKAHRYPIGTILCFISEAGADAVVGSTEQAIGFTEYMRVSAQADADTLTCTRDYTTLIGADTTIWLAGVRFYVAGMAHEEGNAWATRQTTIKALKYNLTQLFQGSTASTWRNQGTDRYGTPGNDFDDQIARMVTNTTLALEQAVLLGRRFVGTATATPASMGGLLYYIDSSYDASVNETDKAGGALVLKDIEDLLQNIAQTVGEEFVPNLIFCDGWGQRKLNSFFEPSVRLGREENTAGLYTQRLSTGAGFEVEFVSDYNMPRGTMLFLNTNQAAVGNHENGRLRTGDVGYSPGDYDQTFIYGDYCMYVKNPVTCGKIINYSLTS